MRLKVLMAVFAFGTIFFVAGSKTVHAEAKQTTQPEPPKTVQVQPGDYLAKIADENQTTYPRLYDANENIKNPDVIYPGDTLRIPKPDEQLANRPLPAEQAPPVVPSPVAAKPAPRAVAIPRPAAPTPATSTYASDGSVWDRLAQCESGGNWAINTGNGFYGGLQFTLSSWRGVGGSGYPNEASRVEQIQRAEALLARQGWGAWPACSSKLGLR